ncbi:hypothetical protein MC7420_1838 [Coleofasciculus chthonoplastes PCC 7420]|uniref:Uncharacterized protein n=1 Tax=Coleofasciculus chthonoplastes PCC 7420 TaxID=118168 RepID=B4VM36_9CYAN|nr:hypothetical protein MC7420_1838 [Coleofasciculus chthonoplastes PCC 7420]
MLRFAQNDTLESHFYQYQVTFKQQKFIYSEYLLWGFTFLHPSKKT